MTDLKSLLPLGLGLSTLLLGVSIYSNKTLPAVGATAALAGSLVLSKVSKVSSEREETLRQLGILKRAKEALEVELATISNVISQANAKGQQWKEEIDRLNKALVKAKKDLREEEDGHGSTQVTLEASESKVAYLEAEKTRLETLIEEHQFTVKFWDHRFEDTLTQHELEVKEYQQEINRLHRELQRYIDNQETILENEKLKLSMQTLGTDDQLRKAVELNKRLESFIQERCRVVEELSQEFEYLTGEAIDGLDASFNSQLTARDSELMRLSGLVAQLQKPYLFEQMGDYARADKLIETLYNLEEPIALDASEIVSGDDQGAFTAFYNLRDRKARGKALLDHLNGLGEVLQHQVACIQPLKFKADPLNPHRIEVSFRYRKAQVSEKSVAKLWKSASQFSSIAGKWSRVRVTGGSESGKSPLAELIACSFQKVKGACDIKLAFPLSGSQKDYWGIPNSYQGYEGVLEAARDLRKLCEQRDSEGTKNPVFTATILDECDTTLEKYRDLATEVKQVIKVGSHNNVGVILLGQNANVKTWKGFDRSDLENLVNVYIGSNSYHGIENSNLSEDEKKTLKETADKLKDYCENLNSDITDESLKVRYALVVEPGKTPYFMELPKFGSMVFDNSIKVTAESLGIARTSEVIKCPKCDSEDVRGNGKTPTGKQRYKCQNETCKKSFSS